MTTALALFGIYVYYEHNARVAGWFLLMLPLTLIFDICWCSIWGASRLVTLRTRLHVHVFTASHLPWRDCNSALRPCVPRVCRAALCRTRAGPGISDVNKYVTTETGSTEQFGLAMTIIYMFIKVGAPPSCLSPSLPAWARVRSTRPSRAVPHVFGPQLAMIALAYGHFTSLGGMQAASHPDQRELAALVQGSMPRCGSLGAVCIGRRPCAWSLCRRRGNWRPLRRVRRQARAGTAIVVPRGQRTAQLLPAARLPGLRLKPVLHVDRSAWRIDAGSMARCVGVRRYLYVPAP